MTPRSVILGASLCAGLVLGLGFLFQIRHLRTQERREVWLEYARGPLKLYVEGSRQGAALLLKPKRLKPAQRTSLGEAVQDLQDSWTQASAQQQDFQADAFFYSLDEAVQWHTAASRLAEAWPRLDRGNRVELATAHQAAEGIRRNLALKVLEQWGSTEEELPWTPAERKESQDLVDALMKPLP